MDLTGLQAPLSSLDAATLRRRVVRALASDDLDVAGLYDIAEDHQGIRQLRFELDDPDDAEIQGIAQRTLTAQPLAPPASRTTGLNTFQTEVQLFGSTDAFLDCDYSRVVFGPTSVTHQLRALVVDGGVYLGWIGGLRRRGASPFDDKTRRRFQAALPALARALAVARRLETATPGEPADFIVRPDGSVEYASRAGAAWLQVPGFTADLAALIGGGPTRICGAFSVTALEAPGLRRFLVHVDPLRPVPCPPHLSPRQREIARRVADGLTLDEVALELRISRDTAKVHLRVVYDRLGVSTRAELVRALIQLG